MKTTTEINDNTPVPSVNALAAIAGEGNGETLNTPGRLASTLAGIVGDSSTLVEILSPKGTPIPHNTLPNILCGHSGCTIKLVRGNGLAATLTFPSTVGEIDKVLIDLGKPQEAIAPTLPQTINDKLCDGTILIGYGKRGHGMNGRDADLDRIGQCLVKSLTTIAPEGCDHYKVLINLRLYASICAPTGEGIWWEELNESVSPELREFFKDHHGIDLATIDWEKDGETPHGPLGETPYEIVEEYFMEQATSIVCGMAPVGDFMFNDDCWDGGTDITLEVPLSVGEHEAIEAGDTDTLDTVAARIAKEIYDANEGGTPERDRLKLFEEEVGMVNDIINGLECYGKKQETPA